MAAVIGAWRHIVLTRTKYAETSTAVEIAKGNSHSLPLPRTRNSIPTAQPTSTLITRLRKKRRASSGIGSEAATIEAMAQIGLSFVNSFITVQTIVVAMKTLTANRAPMRSSYLSPHRVMSASVRADNAARMSLVRFRRVAEQPVNGTCLGGRQRNPVLGRILQRDEEILHLLHRLARHLRPVLEFHLEGEFADEGTMLAASAPDGDVGLGRHPLAEIQEADVLQHFLDDRVADELKLFARLLLEALQHGENLRQLLDGEHLLRAGARAGKLDVVGVEHANPTEAFLERQGLRLEFDTVIARDVRAHIGLGGLLQIGAAMLEDDFRVADRKTILIGNAATQDEGVVVETKIRGVQEQHFANLQRLLVPPLGVDDHAGFGGGLAQHIHKIEKALARGQAVGLQEKFAAEILELVDRQTVRINARLKLRHAADPAFRHGRRTGGRGLGFLRGGGRVGSCFHAQEKLTDFHRAG